VTHDGLRDKLGSSKRKRNCLARATDRRTMHAHFPIYCRICPAALAATLAIGCSDVPTCGPSRALVERVIDGDTVELASGQRLRYVLVDAPEITNGKNACFGAEARDFNRELVEGRVVDLAYGPRCRDRYDRLLAYVSVDGLDLNAELVRSGFACLLHISPDGDDRVEEFSSLQREAQAEGAGLWGACETKPCGD
jgi:micrococcal nuclease